MILRFFLALILPLAAAEPFIVAHRGASHDAPENTLPAFELAWQQGADAIEGDFHLTRDGRIICVHDFDTLRVSGSKKIVKDSTLGELRALDAGAWFKPRWKGTRMPAFSEVAATVPDHGKFFVEVKCGPEIVPVLLEELKSSGLKVPQIVVISFNAEVIRAIKEKAPAYKACWLSSFAKSNPLDPTTASVLETLRATKADGFSSRADTRLSPAYVNAIKSAGFEYHCWTVDDPKTARNFLNLGALSITTNRPAFLREALLKDLPLAQP